LEEHRIVGQPLRLPQSFGRRRACPTKKIHPVNKTPKKSSKRNGRRWSAEVTQHSDALDLEHDVFRSKDPRKIARSLKHSAEQSKRRKGTPYQSAMSMLNFYINRVGKICQKTEACSAKRKGRTARRFWASVITMAETNAPFGFLSF